MHPMYVGQQISSEDQLFWEERKEMLQADLHFFGAGCLDEQNAHRLQQYLCLLGFQRVHVRSDLHASAFATLKDGTGIVAIMGTGSVAAAFDKFELTDRVGGLGYLLGDEGSGFYFGKLLVNEYLEGRLSDKLMQSIEHTIGDRSDVLSKVYSPKGRDFLAMLSKLFGDGNDPELLLLHEQNLRSFLKVVQQRYAKHDQPIHFTGSYACANQEMIEKLMSDMGLSVGKFIARPIEELPEYFFRTAV